MGKNFSLIAVFNFNLFRIFCFGSLEEYEEKTFISFALFYVAQFFKPSKKVFFTCDNNIMAAM
jgi:hypothetical protein